MRAHKLNFKVGGKNLEGNVCSPKSMIYHHFVGRNRLQDAWQDEWHGLILLHELAPPISTRLCVRLLRVLAPRVFL